MKKSAFQCWGQKVTNKKKDIYYNYSSSASSTRGARSRFIASPAAAPVDEPPVLDGGAFTELADLEAEDAAVAVPVLVFLDFLLFLL